jgi:single-strand DNA-binding protein
MAWKKEKLAEHMTKGKPITISGEYKKRQWEDKEGNKRETVEIVVNHIEFQQGTPAGQKAQSEPQPYSSSPVKTFGEDSSLPF